MFRVLVFSSLFQTGMEAMNGLHIVGDLYDCQVDLHTLAYTDGLREVCVRLCQDAGMTVVGEHFFQFEPAGVTGAVLLAESHLAIHTWPEVRNVTLDVYVCNHTCDNRDKAQKLFDLMIEVLKPREAKTQNIERGAI